MNDPSTAPAPKAAPMPAPDAQQRLVVMPVRALLRRAPVVLPPTATVREAALRMREHGVSSMLIVDGGRMLGIVTDRDLRNRVVAAGVAGDTPAIDVATRDPFGIDLRATAFDALLMMARHNVHHLPVVDGNSVVGMLTTGDLAAQQSTSALVLAGEIHACDDVADLQQVAARIGELQRSLAAADASAHATGQVVTAITDALTSRLLQLAEDKLGPPPVRYAWVAAGSQARNEQTARSDQDNCLVLADDYDAARHGEYFAALAREVNAGLDACGYVFCPGGMMAMTDAWRQPRAAWSARFARWIDTPEPKALMHTCVFFDLRAVRGDATLLDAVRRDALARTRGNQVFLSHMVRNALSRRPPIGLFGRLAPSRSGAHRGTVDMKLQGIVPIVDLARAYALAAGHAAVNTFDRLESAAEGHEISEQGARDLAHALEFLAALRIRHQVRRMDAGEPVDHRLRPAELSNFERTQLKEAFAVVQGLQEALGQRYRAQH